MIIIHTHDQASVGLCMNLYITTAFYRAMRVTHIKQALDPICSLLRLGQKLPASSGVKCKLLNGVLLLGTGWRPLIPSTFPSSPSLLHIFKFFKNAVLDPVPFISFKLWLIQQSLPRTLLSGLLFDF